MTGFDLQGLEALARDRLLSQEPIVAERPPIVGEGVEVGDGGLRAAEDSGFGEALTDALREVAALGQDAKDKAAALSRGEPVELHDLFVAMNKSDVAFSLMLEVRNKLVEAWQTLSRSVI